MTLEYGSMNNFDILDISKYVYYNVNKSEYFNSMR